MNVIIVYELDMQIRVVSRRLSGSKNLTQQSTYVLQEVVREKCYNTNNITVSITTRENKICGRCKPN